MYSGGGRREFHETLQGGGGQGKVVEPLVYVKQEILGRTNSPTLRK
jgi:hypothetical protein